MNSKFQIRQFELTIYPRKLWVVKGGSFKDIERTFYIEESEEVDARSKEPLFCFKYLDMKTSLKGCDNSVFKDFVTRMQKLCCLT